MTQDANTLDDDRSVDTALHDLRGRQEEANQFSWGKGIVIAILGKFAGSALTMGIRKRFKNELLGEVMHDRSVQKALSKSATPGQTKTLIDEAMKNAASGMKGMKGYMIRNPLLWGIIGSVGGTVGALGIEYAFHTEDKKENQKNLNDIKTLEDHWRMKIENERKTLKNREI